MAILAWPSILRPASQDFSLVSNTAIFKSPFSGATQTMRYPGARWQTSLTFNNLDDDESRELEVLIAQLDGSSGRIRLWDFGREPAVKRGNPLVNGANQSGDSINTDGWTPSVRVLRKGDYFSIGTEMKMAVADVVSSASGTATITFGPIMRYSPADNVAIEVEAPSSVFMLPQNENGWSRKPAMASDFSLTFIEAFP